MVQLIAALRKIHLSHELPVLGRRGVHIYDADRVGVAIRLAVRFRREQGDVGQGFRGRLAGQGRRGVEGAIGEHPYHAVLQCDD